VKDLGKSFGQCRRVLITYRVFNKTSRRVKIAVDVTFDESNGSQVKKVDSSIVRKEDP
jgi:hypothetical protein